MAKKYPVGVVFSGQKIRNRKRGFKSNNFTFLAMKR